jgi:hydrogenase nickel incorporation protein HypA/HybF
MHELSVARKLLAAVARLANPRDARVRAVHVTVGSASGVVPRALELAFDALTAGSPMEGARLRIAVEPARSRCAACRIEFEFDGLMGACPGCGAFAGALLAGEGLRLESIEVSDV